MPYYRHFFAALLLACPLLIVGCSGDTDPAAGPTGTAGSDGATEATDSPQATDATDPTDGTDSTEPGTEGTDATDATDPADVVDPPPDEGEATDEPDSGPDDVAGTDPPPPPIEATYTAFIGDWTMKSGKEVTKCVVKRLDNPTDIWVTKIQTNLGQGSHHLVLYKSDDTEEQTEPFNCTPFTETLGGDTVPLMISQVAEETMALPDGVAFKFGPQQMVRIEAHYLNYFPDDITAHADITFHTLANADVEHEANMMFYGTPDFSIPAGKDHTTPWFYLDVLPGTKIFAMTGHTHALGTNVEILHSQAKDAQGDAVYPMDLPFQWDEAPIIQYDPPLEFPTGKEGFHYRCSWFNDTGKNVGFGESANKEMCFFWAYYYPSQGYRLCVNPGSMDPTGGTLGEQVCCPGSFVCDLIKQYLIDGF